MMERLRFTIDDWRELSDHSGPACISLFMPMMRAGRETRQNAIRFKNALSGVERGMAERGHARSEIAATISALAELSDQEEFWRHQGEGLAVFARDEEVVGWGVTPLRLPQATIVSRRFQLTPLLPLALGDGLFYVLIASQNSIEALECSRQGFTQLAVEGLPPRRDAIDRFVEEDRGLQAQSVPGAAPSRGRGALMFHGQGAPDAHEKARIFEYFRKVDQALDSVIRSDRAPVVFAGVEYLFPIYRQANRSLNLLPECVHGNFDPVRVDLAGLHARAWKIVEPAFQGDRVGELALVREAVAKNRGSRDLETIVEAGAAGLIEHLVVNPAVQQWGEFDEEPGRVVRDGSGTGNNEDLINLAAIFAMRGNAAVTIAADDDEPARGGAIAAAFRTPVPMNR